MKCTDFSIGKSCFFRFLPDVLYFPDGCKHSAPLPRVQILVATHFLSVLLDPDDPGALADLVKF